MYRRLLIGFFCLVTFGTTVIVLPCARWRVIAFIIGQKRYNGRPLSTWLRMLKSADVSDRAQATKTFDELGPDDVDAVPLLVNGLQDQDPFVQRISANALGRIGPGATDALEPLIRLLIHHQVGEDAGAAIVQMGPAALPTLLRFLADDREWILHNSIIDVIARLGRSAKSAVPVLMETIDRERASRQQGRRDFSLPDGTRVEATSDQQELFQWLQENQRCRQGAIKALGCIGPEARISTPILVEVRMDSDEYVQIRLAAEDALSKLGVGESSIVDSLVELVKSDAPHSSRERAAVVLIRLLLNWKLSVQLRPI